MIVYTITPGEGMNPCTERDLNSIQVWLEQAEPGDEFIIKVSEMTEVEYSSLPEYMGP
jgi:hypothetical protein